MKFRHGLFDKKISKVCHQIFRVTPEKTKDSLDVRSSYALHLLSGSVYVPVTYLATGVKQSYDKPFDINNRTWWFWSDYEGEFYEAVLGFKEATQRDLLYELSRANNMPINEVLMKKWYVNIVSYNKKCFCCEQEAKGR